jgi:hypothetical protein
MNITGHLTFGTLAAESKWLLLIIHPQHEQECFLTVEAKEGNVYINISAAGASAMISSK